MGLQSLHDCCTIFLPQSSEEGKLLRSTLPQSERRMGTILRLLAGLIFHPLCTPTLLQNTLHFDI